MGYNDVDDAPVPGGERRDYFDWALVGVAVVVEVAGDGAQISGAQWAAAGEPGHPRLVCGAHASSPSIPASRSDAAFNASPQ
jgi:hypothetical protein